MTTVEVTWGRNGLLAAEEASTVVIVDVLSFSTALDVACTRGALVYPYGWNDAGVADFAAAMSARVASPRRASDRRTPSLSPSTLRYLKAGDRLVLPSPNGSTLSSESSARRTIAGCLRNAASVAAHLNALKCSSITLVAAGERWPDGSLRVALEDCLGAGAISTYLEGEKSEEALASQAVFAAASRRLEHTLKNTASGRELTERGFGGDVGVACMLDCSSTVPILREGAYVAAADGPD